MKLKALWLCSIILLILISCNNNETPKQSSIKAQEPIPVKPLRELADKLTQEVAESRKKRVSNIEYTLDIDLVSMQDAYKGKVEINFDLKTSDKDLTIDFTGGEVQNTVVNGENKPVNYSGYFITLSAQSLKVGANNVLIEYSHPYDQDGTGLHRYIEPEDNRTYLYTYLWPYYANRLFPNFDQPNLKATYEMTVRAQSDWHVISSVMEDQVTEEGESKVWHFPRSKKFSSYIFSLHAGPYKVWQDMAGDVPIRLFSRQSLAEYVADKEWLEVTKMGLEHFKNYFDIPYPFEKYDQIIVPDFNIGAMENVAAVTFAEYYYVQQGTSNRLQRQRRAETILHEMAHMWFGNLVTKDWWNGLWLNESFATLMASIAVSQIPDFSDYWHDFYLNTNLSAIDADNKVSTHPIEMNVASTDDFFAVFDTITYDKGASVLNQLSHYTGQENFRLGVSNYLKKHAWGNTELADFIHAQSKQSGLELDSWSEDWLYNAGVNKIKADYSCENGRINRFEILQSAPEGFTTLRSQRLQLALFDTKNAEMKPFAVIPVFISAANTPIAEVLEMDCPYLVYPNYQGWGYTEVELDKISQENAFAAIEKASDPLLKSMLWTSVLNNPDIVFENYISSIKNEQNDRIINKVLSSLIEKIDQHERQKNNSFKQESLLLEELLWQQVNNAAISQSTRLIQLENYINVIRSPKGIEQLKQLLDQHITLPDININQQHRWDFIKRLAILGDEKTSDYFSNEKISDNTDAGRLSAIAVEASLADESTKRKWLSLFMQQQNPLPLSHQRVAMASLFPPNQTALQEILLPPMLDALEEMYKTRDNYYQRSYAQDLFAGVCSVNGLSLMQTALDKNKIGTTLYKFLSENVQSTQECIKTKQ